MRTIFLLLSLLSLVGAESSRTVDCNKIFEERKEELLKELETIDEETAAFESLKSATNAMIDKKQAKLDEKEKSVDAKLAEIKEREESIKKLVDENKKMLENIKEAKDDKIANAYTKMKDGAAGEILNNLEPHESAKILFNLKAKKMATVMSKMEPVKASEVTKMLTKGPPFKKEEKKKSEKKATAK
jgi:flagellar motility protein MotE (MotC chaperone)